MLPPKSSTYVTVKSRLAQSARTYSVDHALNYILLICLSILLPRIDEQQKLNCDTQVYMSVRICVELQTSSERCLQPSKIVQANILHRHCDRQVRSTTGKTVNRTSVGVLQFSERVSLEALVKKVRCL